MKNSLKKGLQLYASRQFLFLQSSLFRLVWPAVLVLLSAQVQMSLQEDCPRALGMEDRRIPDSSIKASSAWSSYDQAANGRLNFREAWYANRNDKNPWFEVSFGSATTISQVATQRTATAWVKTFVLSYSKDGNTFVFYNNQHTFQGNTNHGSIKKNELKPAIFARVIRIYPKTWSRYAAMRVEFYGCKPVSQGNVTGQAISAESIEVKWKFVGNKKDNSLPCGFTVWYRAEHTSGTNNNTWINQTVDTNTTDYIIRNLLAYTTYDIYVEALNDACSERLSRVAQVTTHEKAPSAPPRDITVVSLTYNSIVLQWLPPPVQSRNGKLLQYLVRSWPADVFINSSIARNYSHDNTSIEQKGRFVGLKSDTNYIVVLTVSNRVGTSSTSSPLYFRTLKVPKTEEMFPTVEASPYVITGVVWALVLLIAIIAVYMYKKRRKNKGSSDAARCNQFNDKKLSEEQSPMYENDNNLGSSNETTDNEAVQGNAIHSPVSRQMQNNTPSNKTLAEYEVMGKLCSTQTLEDSRVNTAQPQMKPEYSNLKGPDLIPMTHSDHVYQHLNKKDTGSGAYECLRKQGSCDCDVSWSSPNNLSLT